MLADKCEPHFKMPTCQLWNELQGLGQSHGHSGLRDWQPIQGRTSSSLTTPHTYISTSNYACFPSCTSCSKTVLQQQFQAASSDLDLRGSIESRAIHAIAKGIELFLFPGTKTRATKQSTVHATGKQAPPEQTHKSRNDVIQGVSSTTSCISLNPWRIPKNLQGS